MSGDLTARDDLVQQLAEVLAGERWPDLDGMSPQNRAALIEAQKPAARAVLRSGLVVAASDVRDLTQQIERDSDGRASFLAVAAWLRALTQQEPQ